jgi:hypothetical protein
MDLSRRISRPEGLVGGWLGGNRGEVSTCKNWVPNLEYQQCERTVLYLEFYGQQKRLQRNKIFSFSFSRIKWNEIHVANKLSLALVHVDKLLCHH